MGIKLNLKNVRVGYVNVFEKGKDRTAKNGDAIKGKFGATIYLEKDDPQVNKLESTVLEVLTEAMGSATAAEKWMSRNYGFGNHADKCCVRDLEERDEPVEGLEEGLYFTAGAHKRPKIQTSLGENQHERGLTVEGDEIEGQEVYSGCYANVSVELYWYGEYKVLMCNLLGIRFRKDGVAFGGAGETANDDDLGDDDAPRKKVKPSASRREEEEEAPRRSRREEEEEAPRRSRREEEERPHRRSR